MAGWIADKSSDPATASHYYQQVLDQSDQAKQPELFNYLKAHILELQTMATATASIEKVSTEGHGRTIDYSQFVRGIRDGGQEGSVVGQSLATAMEMQIKADGATALINSFLYQLRPF